jgi:hypothetical protein
VQVAVINQRNAAIVMSSVSEPEMGVVVGNGSSGSDDVPDGRLTIQADFAARTLMIAPHGGSSGKVTQESGKVSLHEVLIALNNADGLEASYDLNSGSLVVEDLVIGGAAGKGSFRLTGSGADAEVGNKLSVGETSELRLIAGGGGMPTLRLAKGASVTFAPGAKLVVEGGAGVAAGKVVLIESDQPLGAQLKDHVEFSGFGQVKIIENAPGLTVDILAP